MKYISLFVLVFCLSGLLFSAGRPQVISRIDAAAQQLMLLEGFFRGQSSTVCREAYRAATAAFRKRLARDGVTLNPAEERYWEKSVKPAFSLNGGSGKKRPFRK